MAASNMTFSDKNGFSNGDSDDPYNGYSGGRETNGYNDDVSSISDDDDTTDAPLDFSMKKDSVDEAIVNTLPRDTLNSGEPRRHSSYVDKEPTNSSYGSIGSSPESVVKSEPLDGPRRKHSSREHSSRESTSASSPTQPRNNISMIPGLSPGMFPANVMGAFPAAAMAAAFSDPSRLHDSMKVSRPYGKSYPKDAVSAPMGYYGIPGYMPYAGMDGATAQQIMNSEEMMNMYRQQLQRLRDRQAMARITHHSSGSSSSASTPTTPTTATSSANDLAQSSSTSHQGPMNSHQTPTTTTSGRKRPRSLPDEQKDQAYWERRRKNNDAAKRSRDARRAKEDEIAIRAAFLEQENLKLRVEVAALKNETAKLRCMLYNS